MNVQARQCDGCKRRIAGWVTDLGYTIGHNKKNYCRFCYVRMRGDGKVRPREDDSEFLAGINWELDLIEQKKKRIASKQQGVCPACNASLSFNLRGIASAEGICPQCNAHIQILRGGTIRLVPTRTSIILSVAKRLGERPDSTEHVYSFLMDEISARLSEHPILGIPELGTFKVLEEGRKVVIEFKPARLLLARMAAMKRKKKT